MGLSKGNFRNFSMSFVGVCQRPRVFQFYDLIFKVENFEPRSDF